ncbi:TPA: hypothetical protein N0F65_000929 [Lagenidium giganteum]|uniref:Uncharacterized protein n=1 Tax=Lagenidium giganteum TaxID=4803 RepID=A0AAV2YPV8_9STRA|nr:TPA: hypothetical protein N0F65_000929 [Lagenidium giganteum]
MPTGTLSMTGVRSVGDHPPTAVGDMEEDHHGLLADADFLFDTGVETVTCRFDYGDNVSVLLSYAKDEPGAAQSGHYVWPAAPALCRYLQQHPTVIPKGTIVELGTMRVPIDETQTWVGIPDVNMDLQPAARVIFTDHDPGVLKTIAHNVKQQERPQATCQTQALRWGPDGAEEIAALEALQQTGQQSTAMIVGTDVIYAREIVPLLFWTVDRLLSRATKDAMFLMCSSMSYDDSTEAEIEAQCVKYNLERHALAGDQPSDSTRICQFQRRA